MPFVLRDKPERIVCLTEEPTEILYLLGEDRRVVGISAYTCRPPRARDEKPVVSAFVGGSVEKICALEPDLVVGFSDIQAELARKLIAANLQVLIFNQRSVQEVLDVISVLGRIIGAGEKAEALVQGYVERLERIRAAGRRRPRRPRVYFEEWDDPMISAIRWVSELIEVAGGEDIFAERSAGKQAKDRFVSAGEVLDRRPDVLIASWCGKPLDREAVMARPGWREMPAIASGRLYELDPAIILQPGPACLTDGLDALVRILDEVQ
jgi:iron complex transport system substrate-binding protein